MSAIFGGLTNHFEAAFEPLRNETRRSDAPSAHELAEQLLVVIEGGVVLSRVLREPLCVPQALRLFRQHLELLVEAK